MGVPPDIEFGNNCLACFPAGKTPKTVWLKVSGVMPGEDWLPAKPPLPNGIYELPQTLPCAWAKAFGIWLAAWLPNEPATLITVVHNVFHTGYAYNHLPSCQVVGANDFNVWANNVYYGGYGQITWVP